MKTAALTDLTDLYIQGFASDPDITAFCQQKYGKNPLIIEGVDINSPPTEDDCPFIVLGPLQKHEGEDIQDFKYSTAIGWSISNKNTDTSVENVVRFMGVRESDQLGQLILKAAAKVLLDSWISEANYLIDTTSQFPQFPGEMELIIEVPNTIGVGTITF